MSGMVKQVDFPRQWLLIAHRGVSSEALENSRQAFQLAIDLGCDFIECDVQQSKEGIPVVIHDKTVNRTTNAIGKTTHFSVEELQKLGIPTLEEVMALARDRIGLFIELKTKEFFPILRSYRSTRPLLVGSFHTDIAGLDIGIAENKKMMKEHIAGGRKILALHKRLITPLLVEECQEQNLKVFAWTVDNQEEGQNLLRIGVKGIITNHPRAYCTPRPPSGAAM